jgi:hypothetical protein
VLPTIGRSISLCIHARRGLRGAAAGRVLHRALVRIPAAMKRSGVLTAELAGGPLPSGWPWVDRVPASGHKVGQFLLPRQRGGMEPKCQPCAVCGDAKHPREFVVEGHAVVLCRAHAAIVARGKPSSWQELRDLLRPRCGLSTLADRRSPLSRRDQHLGDRRFFPRPEGRRKKPGRRITDAEG